MSYRQTTVAGLPALALRSDLVELVVVPAAGMRITNLRRHRGREWLWQNPDIPLAAPSRGAPYVETADSGGWDECFPEVEPNRGELWQGVWTATVYEHVQGTTLLAGTRGRELPYELTREITLDQHEPVARFRYRLAHTGGAPFRWIWSASSLVNVQPGTTVELPGVRQVRIGASHGRPDLERDDTVSWAGAIGGDADRFTFPEPAGWALKLFGDVGSASAIRVTDPREGERLEIRADPAEVPQAGLWINAGGWGAAGAARYYNLGLQPRIGAPDRLDEAAEAWGTAQTLESGAERIWGLDVALLAADEYDD